MALITIAGLPEKIAMGNSNFLPMNDGIDTYRITKENFTKNIPISALNTRYVAKSGSDGNTGTIGDPFLTVKAAMDSVTDATALKPYLIQVLPGIYQEVAAITAKNYVCVSGYGKKTTTIIAADGENLFDLSQYSMLDNLRVAGENSILINGYNGLSTAYLNDINIGKCLVGILSRHTDSTIEYTGCYCEEELGTVGDFIKSTAGLIHLRNGTVYGNPTITRGLNVDGPTAIINVCNFAITSSNVSDCFYVDNGGSLAMFNTLQTNATNGVHIGNNGTGSSFMARNIHFGADVYDIYNESATADINLIGINMSRGKIKSECGIKATSWYDPTEDKFRSEGNVSIGIDGKGHSLEVGEGGSYKFGVRTLTYDGTSYVEVANGHNIVFPNLNVGTALYFGDDKSLDFYGLQYLMGTTKILLGAGGIVWEYFDAENGWQEFKCMNTITGYSDSYNCESFIGDSGVSQTIRFDQNIKTGVKESTATNTGTVATTINGILGIWVRCRIAVAITTSPIFRLPRLLPSYMCIRDDGSQVYHGKSRGMKNVNLAFGDSGGGGDSKTLDVSPNISYPFWNNGLNDASTMQLYFRFVVTEDVDTSSGLLLKYIASAAYTGGADLLAKIKIYFSRIKSGDRFVNTNPETTQDADFAYTAGEASNLAHFITIGERVDISDLSEDDIVFVMIQRSGADLADTLAASVDFSNVWVEYRVWQQGKKLLA